MNYPRCSKCSTELKAFPEYSLKSGDAPLYIIRWKCPRSRWLDDLHDLYTQKTGIMGSIATYTEKELLEMGISL